MPKNEKDPLWSAYTKTVRPLKSGEAKNPLPNLARPLEGLSPARKPPRSYDLPVEGPGDAKMRQLDTHMERSLNRGRREVEARLDLHGFTQAEAFRELEKFLERNVEAGRRTLLVVTGKGRGERLRGAQSKSVSGARGRGVLRERLAGWLAASAHAADIIGFREAAPRDGGAGAFYVLLRRKQ